MLPVYLLIESFENEIKCYMELITLFGIFNQCIFHMLTLALLSVLRYYPISCQRNISGKRVILIYIIIFGSAVCAFSIIIWVGDISFAILYTYSSIFFAILNVIIQVIVVSSNVMLLKYVRTIESENRVNNIHINNHKRAINTILILSISLTICATPSAVISSINAYILLNGENDSSGALKECMNWSYMLFTLYSGINSIIYIFRSKIIVEYYKPIIMNYFTVFRENCLCNRNLSEIRKREET